MAPSKEDEEFTVKLANLAAKYPSLQISVSLVNSDTGEAVMTIPHDDLDILDADVL